MRTKHFKISTTTIGLLCICIVGANASNTSALTYQSSVTNSFTIEDSVSIELSSSELKIDNLTPGQSADSNVITITTESNAGKFTLNSTVGNSTYNTTDLVQSDVEDSFSILSSSGDLDFGKWGFSISVEKDGNDWIKWSQYSGLPIYSDESASPINLVTDADTRTTIAFKIGAKASASQAAGEYNNVINFIAVTAPTPTTPTLTNTTCTTPVPDVSDMQSFATLSDDAKAAVLEKMTEDAEYGILDSRDKKTYCVAKLKDGHVWMTQNLDLDLSTSTELKHADTDLGWGTDTATTTWTPARSTINAVTDATTAGSITGWTDNDNEPYSVDPGDWYWKGVTFYPHTNCYVGNNYQICNYITKSVSTYSTYFTTDVSDSGVHGSHGHVGNYYNWSAAVASNDTSGYADTTISDITKNPQNSICPAGWRLPTIYGTSNTDAGTNTSATNEFRMLNGLYNSNPTSTSQNLVASPLFFVRGGRVNNGSLNYAGHSGYYWSSTVYSSLFAYNFTFYSNSDVRPANGYRRHSGCPVRCVVR